MIPFRGGILTLRTQGCSRHAETMRWVGRLAALDGHVLRLGAESRPDDPPGTRLDDEGVRGQAQPDGGWTRVE